MEECDLPMYNMVPNIDNLPVPSKVVSSGLHITTFYKYVSFIKSYTNKLIYDITVCLWKTSQSGSRFCINLLITIKVIWLFILLTKWIIESPVLCESILPIGNYRKCKCCTLEECHDFYRKISKYVHVNLYLLKEINNLPAGMDKQWCHIVHWTGKTKVLYK